MARLWAILVRPRRGVKAVKIKVRTYLWAFLAALVLAFIIFAFVQAGRGPVVAAAPATEGVPARVYGRLEPAGGEVFVAPAATRRVIALPVREGDAVTRGQVLARLDDAVERAQYNVAVARRAAAGKAARLSADAYERNRGLRSGGQVSEYELSQSQVKAEYDRANWVAAEREVELARAQLNNLALTAPVDGVVYKLDLRLGETVAAGDNSRVVVGPARLGVRLFVESFWKGRVKVGARYKVYDAETNEYLGTGIVAAVAPYVGGRKIPSEDPRERFDVGFQEVILDFAPVRKDLPIGLNVVAILGG